MTIWGLAPSSQAANPGDPALGDPQSAPSRETLEGVSVFGDQTEPDPLRPGEVHLWFVDLHVHPGLLTLFFSLLSRDERERAERFRFDTHRRRYVARRGVLRWLLGRYLGLPGSSLAFGYGEAGKPFLAPELQPSALPEEFLTFNLSDSEDAALYAFGHGIELGVDVEHVRNMPDALSIADYSFSPREIEALNALDPEEASLGFFHCWTRKEAYVKATGQGLGAPLADFTVSLGVNVPAAFLCFEKGLDDVAAWSLFHLDPNPDHVGALAVRGHGLRPVAHRWLPPL